MLKDVKLNFIIRAKSKNHEHSYLYIQSIIKLYNFNFQDLELSQFVVWINISIIKQFLEF